MGLVLNLEFTRINTKSHEFSQFLHYHIQAMRVMLYERRPSSLSYQGAWVNLALHRSIQDFRIADPVLIPYFRSQDSLKVLEMERGSSINSTQLSKEAPIHDELSSN